MESFVFCSSFFAIKLLNVMVPLYGYCAAASRLQSHYEKQVYVYVLSNKSRWVTCTHLTDLEALSWEPPWGFKPGIPALVTQSLTSWKYRLPRSSNSCRLLFSFKCLASTKIFSESEDDFIFVICRFGIVLSLYIGQVA